ncbi:phospholipase A2 group XV-like [Uloborus diversus]|uniref:phospholipase A2 group XV-like n=1 Tax=Uloborus diversus TaxID=327109 RepID=UPI00240A5E93|nr:phospholipase A2 group XV-like [Uloborus diversus]
MTGWFPASSLTAGVVFFTLLVSFPLDSSAFHLLKRTNTKSPVILVPGDGGSQLEAKLDKPSTVHYFCNKKTDDYFSLWLNLELLVPYVVDCWVDNMRLVYDNVTRTTSNAPGVLIRVPGFGNTTYVEWLDPSQISPSAYFTGIVEALLTLGYTRGIDIKGAPYDYRKAPNEMAGYFDAVKKMSEEMFVKNSEAKITYVCHSMGCPLMSYFFNQQAQDWKDKHVKALVSLGGAWGGAVKAMKAFASGENLDVFVINQNTVRTEQRTCPSLAYVLPSDSLWKQDEVLVITQEKNYTLGNLYDFFKDINFPVGYEMYKDTYSYAVKSLQPPNVEIHCLHGINVTNTVERLFFPAKKFPDEPTIVYGNGDGTVNVRSLEACLRWQGQQKQKIYHLPLNNVDHMNILSDINVLEHIKRVVMS